MTVLKYSDLADSGLYVKTNTKGQPNGVASLDSNAKVPLSQLPSGTGGTQGIQGIQGISGDSGSGSSAVYKFKVTFNQASPESFSEVPSGWSVSASGTTINVTHNVGTYPKLVSYLGYNSGTYHYRTPTQFDELLISSSSGPSTTTFSMALTNDVAGSQQSGHAYVCISF